MAQQKALKNTATRPGMIDVSGRSPATTDEEFEPVGAFEVNDDLEPQAQPSMIGSAAQPPTPQTPYTATMGQIGQTAMTYGAPIVEAAASSMPMLARTGFLPGMLAAGGVGAAASALFDNLRNYTVSDPSQKLSNRQILQNALMAGGLSALGEGASRSILGALFKKAKDAGNDAIANEVGTYASEMYGDKTMLEAAEKLGMELGGAKVTLTPEEAFPMNPQAIAMSRSILTKYPDLGAVQAFKLAKIKEAMLQYGGSFGGANLSNLKDATGTIIENYGRDIKSLQSQVNTIAEGKTFPKEAEQILATLRSEMENLGGRFEGDVLTGLDEAGIGAVYSVYKDLRRSLSIPAEPEQYSRIVGTDGKPFVVKEATPEGIKPLSINDINRVLRQLQTTANFGQYIPGEKLTPSEKVARNVYKSVVDLRDEANIAVAQQSGNDALAKELRSRRDFYKNNIEGLQIIQENLAKEPSDIIPYLIKTDNPAEFGKIFSVLSEQQKTGLKGDFLRHLIDPVAQRAMNVIPDSSFRSALDQLMKYDPKITGSIYSPKEMDSIMTFLKLGERVEKFGDSVKAQAAKEGIMNKMWLMLANPKMAAAKLALDKFVETMSSNSNVRAYLDAKSYMAGLKGAQELAPAALEIAEKKMAGGEAFKIRVKRQAVMQGAKELLRQRSQE